MKTIAIGNRKGGVGKTVTAVSLAAALCLVFKKRVLLVDADPQGSATKHLMGEDYKVNQHLGRALIKGTLEGMVILSESGLDLLPCDMRLEIQRETIEDQDNWAYLLRQALATAKLDYDYVIIDCPPTLKTFTILALVAADAYLVPTDPEQWGVRGAGELVGVANGLRNVTNPQLELLGLVVTRYHKNLKNANHDKMIKQLHEKYGKAMGLPTIRRDKTVLDAIAAATTIFNINPECNAAQDYTALAAAVLERL